MSARSIRRARRREGERTRRRVRRSAVATGVALGAGALIAPAADAANFPVSTTANGGLGSLRAQVADANANAGPDTITFTGAGASGEITLTSGEIAITDDLTITGPGAGALAVSGDSDNDDVRDFATNVNPGDTRIFSVSDPTSPGAPLQQVSMSGLTLREGVADRYAAATYYKEPGGAIYAGDTALSLAAMTFTSNVATLEGGAVAFGSGPESGTLSITGSTFAGNSALRQGGAISASPGKYGAGDGNVGSQITNSTITGNRAGGSNFGAFGSDSNPDGGGLAAKYGTLVVDATTIANNTASTTTGLNTNGSGGGASLVGDIVMTNSTVRDNTSGGIAGGVMSSGAKLRSSTVSGNTAPDFGGGVIARPKYGTGGPTRIDNSTISGNSVTGAGPSLGRGGGVSTFNYSNAPALVTRNSTIASNTATTGGGGIQALFIDDLDDPIIEMKSTLVADNTAAGTGSDLGSFAGMGASNAGAFSAGFTLVENPGTVLPAGNPDGSNILGVDPQLSPLVANGGSTQTHAIGPTSAAIDAAQANGFTTDQRGQPRTVDAAATNNSISDGTDIGAFERADTTANGDDPETVFTKKPRKKVKLKAGKKTVKVKFKFTGTDNAPPPGALTFECSVDGAKFDDCSSPLKLRLKRGKHTVDVRAIDADGNVDATPAEATVKVKKAERKPKSRN